MSKPDIRRERIVDLVRERDKVTVDELAAWLGSSRETIRRDLSQLDSEGRIRKFHGGATLSTLHREGRFAERMVEAVAQKRAIGATAAALFEPGSTLFVDVGTTTLMFAEALCRHAGLTVITNGLDIARMLANAGATVFVIGGELKAETGEMVGALAVEQIAHFHATHAVITVAGLGNGGARDFQLDEAQIARAMIARARIVTVLADSSKFGRDALFEVCPFHDIDRLVVDTPPRGQLAADLAAAAVEIVVAGV